MTRRSHNLAVKESREERVDVAKATVVSSDRQEILVASGSVENSAQASQLATSCLKLREVKAWSIDLVVHQRTIQRWISGEVAIPAKWISTIIAIAKGYFLDLHKLEDAIDRELFLNFGRKDSI